MKIFGVKLSTYCFAGIKVLGIYLLVWGVFVETGAYTAVAVAVLFAIDLVDDFIQAAQSQLNENLLNIMKRHYSKHPN